MTNIVLGPLTGVRFWTYTVADMKITSFQYFHDWIPGQSLTDPEPKAYGHGLMVYKTIDDAMRGNASVFEGLQEMFGRWLESGAGIVLGTVEFWGEVYEHEFGYAAETVKPTRFLKAWGARADAIVDELNVLWFGERHGRDR